MTDPLALIRQMTKTGDELEAEYRRQLDEMNDLGATDEQVAAAAIQHQFLMATGLIDGTFRSRGAGPDDLARAAVEALRHCGRLAAR
jgi:hypothetical protein